jgi:signal transduction histidine kinase
MSSVPRELEPTERRTGPAPVRAVRRDAAATLRRIGSVALAMMVTALPIFSPTIGNSEVRIIWVPLAILSFVFAWLPRREAPLYALIYAAITLAPEFNRDHLPFHFVETLIGVGEALGLALLVPRHLNRTQMVMQPARVIGYIVATGLITLVGATLALVAAHAFQLSPEMFIEELGPQPSLGWRYWWLGHACGFAIITGTLTFLKQVDRADWGEIIDDLGELRGFYMATIAQLFVTLFVMPVFDRSAIGIPSDVALGLLFVPLLTSIAMTLRFRGFGTSVALLTITPISIYSIAGPMAARNWIGLPEMVTPVHLILIVSATTCWVLASNLRHLQWAIRDAVEASEMKSRFIAMLNHELRTPLNAILGFSELMRMQNQRAIDHALGPVDNIHASGQRLLAMIEGLLSQTDKGASAFEIHKQRLNLRETIQNCIDEIEPQLHELGRIVTVDADDQLEIDADSRALRQMLSVLLSYPLRFVGPETSISVAAQQAGTDTLIQICSTGLINAVEDDRDKIELQLVNALALAHGARLHIVQQERCGRTAKLTFFATHAAH